MKISCVDKSNKFTFAHVLARPLESTHRMSLRIDFVFEVKGKMCHTMSNLAIYFYLLCF